MSYYLERQARFIKLTKDGAVPSRLPGDVNADLRVSWQKPVPPLKGIAHTPVMTADGTIVTSTGYQADTELYYDPVGEPVPAVPETPSSEDVARARSILLNEWLVDFPFDDDASLAHAVAMAVTGVVRELVDGPTPLFLIDAPTAGTGKGLLAATTGCVITGAAPAVTTQPNSGEEFRKRLTALFMRGATMILLDNIKGELAAAELAAALTATVWEDRILGVSRTARVPNRALWVATGNNVQLDFDIARRTVPIRIDPKLDRPWERSGFRHDPLLPWVTTHRHELVWALLVLARHWVAIGRPAWREGQMGSFESWAGTVGGILAAAGIEGFLANRAALYTVSDPESEEWRAFVAAWHGRHGLSAVTVRELARLVEGGLLPYLYAKRDLGERQLYTRLGMELSRRRDRRIGGCFIRLDGTDPKTKAKRYRLEPPEAEPSPLGSAKVPPPRTPADTGDPEPTEPAEPAEPLTAVENASHGDRGHIAHRSLGADQGSEGSARSASPMNTGDIGAEPQAPKVPQVPPRQVPCRDKCGATVSGEGQRCSHCAAAATAAWASRRRRRR